MGVDARSLHVPGILELADRGIRLLIPDQRGHGASSRSDAAEYTHARWAADIRQFTAALGLERFALLGHSYGGFIALEYACRWPQSLSHLILVASSAGPVRAASRRCSSDDDVQHVFRAVWPAMFAGNDKQWPLFESLTFSSDAYNAAFGRELAAYDVRDRIGAIDCPMLLVVGDGDAYRSQMEWLATHAANAALHVLPGVGHFPFIEAREHFVQLVGEFVTRG